MQLLPTPQELKQKLPLLEEDARFVMESRSTIKRILDGEDKRLLLIVGPCSIHNKESAKEYAAKLRHLAEEVSESLFIVMRGYIEKPRTVRGWKGFLYDPHLDGSEDVGAGLFLSRELLLELTRLHVPVAMEFLDPIVPYYFGDLVSWASFGARTVTSQIHRQMASTLPMPVGFKNNTDGNVEVAVQAVLSALEPHAYFGLDSKGRLAMGKSLGNPDAHVVLRGGEKRPNYDAGAVAEAAHALSRAGLPARMIIDCSHDNAGKDHTKQPHVFQAVLQQVISGNRQIVGMMLESHLQAGAQVLRCGGGEVRADVSVTDPCMDWQTTERLIRFANASLLEPSLCHYS